MHLRIFCFRDTINFISYPLIQVIPHAFQLFLVETRPFDEFVIFLLGFQLATTGIVIGDLLLRILQQLLELRLASLVTLNDIAALNERKIYVLERTKQKTTKETTVSYRKTRGFSEFWILGMSHSREEQKERERKEDNEARNHDVFNQYWKVR
jgi:hypothetical protein